MDRCVHRKKTGTPAQAHVVKTKIACCEKPSVGIETREVDKIKRAFLQTHDKIIGGNGNRTRRSTPDGPHVVSKRKTDMPNIKSEKRKIFYRFVRSTRLVVHLLLKTAEGV
jgi:hypothetical protein